MTDKDCKRKHTVTLGADVEGCSRSNAKYGLTTVKKF